MLKFKIIDIVLLVMIVLILDTLYLLPLYVPLDSKPNSIRSAAYLAKSIAKEAKCDDTSLFVNFTYTEKDTVLDFTCAIGTDIYSYTYFTIHIFLNNETKDEMIKNRNTYTSVYNDYHRPCFKKGPAYMICGPDIKEYSKGKPILYGQKYYKQFPGEDLEYTVN